MLRRAAEKLQASSAPLRFKAVVADRRGIVSLRDGAEPTMQTFATAAEEEAAVVAAVRGALDRGVPPEAIAVLARTKSLLEDRFAPALRLRARRALPPENAALLIEPHEFLQVCLAIRTPAVEPKRSRITEGRPKTPSVEDGL